MYRVAFLGVTSVLLTSSLTAQAAECGCDHSIEVGTTNVKGADLGAQPGDVVCVQAGERPFLVLEGFVGTAAAPVVIKNCGGQVKIKNADRGYGLLINACTTRAAKAFTSAALATVAGIFNATARPRSFFPTNTGASTSATIASRILAGTVCRLGSLPRIAWSVAT